MRTIHGGAVACRVADEAGPGALDRTRGDARSVELEKELGRGGQHAGPGQSHESRVRGRRDGPQLQVKRKGVRILRPGCLPRTGKIDLVDVPGGDVLLSTADHADVVFRADAGFKVKPGGVRGLDVGVWNFEVAELIPPGRVVVVDQPVGIDAEDEPPVVADPAVKPACGGARRGQRGADFFPVTVDVSFKNLHGFRRERRDGAGMGEGRVQPDETLATGEPRRHFGGCKGKITRTQVRRRFQGMNTLRQGVTFRHFERRTLEH
ncbi:MAG: hypothetical protein R3F13_19685 [Prosthecobacter sp.]